MRRQLLAATLILAGCASQPPPTPMVIVKHDLAPPPAVVVPRDPMANLSPDVQAAIRNHQTPTLHDGIATIYPYSPNKSWTVYCAPLTATEIRLNPDESTDKDGVVLGDSVRWSIKVSRQAVMVEPLGTTDDPNMVSNLIIATNRRSYHFILRLRTKAMTAVQFYYADDVRQLEAARQVAQAEAAKQATQPAPTLATPASEQTATK
jgi:type IV secretory pathway VirB9-like protein